MQHKRSVAGRARILMALTVTLVDAFGSRATAQPPRAQQLQIRVAFPGHDVVEVEALLAEPLERALMTVDGVIGVRSVSQPGQVRLTLEFKADRALDQAIQGVRAQLLVASLPPSAEAPTLEIDRRGGAIDHVIVSNVADPSQSSDALQSLATIPGVAALRLIGVPRPLVRVEVDPTALRTRGIRLADVLSAFGDATKLGGPSDLESLQSMPIAGAGEVRLSDIAGVRVDAERNSFCLRNGAPVVAAQVRWQPESSPAEASAGLSARADEVRSRLIGSTVEVFPRPDLHLLITVAAGASPEQMWETAGVVARVIADAPGTEDSLVYRLDPDSSDEGSQDLDVFVRLDASRRSSKLDAYRQLAAALAQVPSAISIFPVDLADGVTSLNVEFSGSDLEILDRLSAAAQDRARGIPGVEATRRAWTSPAPSLKVDFDQARMAALSVSADVAELYLRAARTGISGGSVRWANQSLDLSLGLSGINAHAPELAELPLPGPQGKSISLADVSTIQFTTTPSAILRSNGSRVSGVRMIVSQATAAAAVRKRIEEGLDVPPGFSISWSSDPNSPPVGRNEHEPAVSPTPD